MTIKPTFQGEVQLAGWSESHNGGAKVTFFLPEASDLDAFRAMTVRKGNVAGQRLAMVLVEIGDDELPVEPEAAPAPAPAPEAPKGGQLAKLAALFCGQPEFWRFLSETYLRKPDEGHIITSAEEARFVVLKLCGNIKSRAELDHNEAAARAFHDKVRLPYLRWQQGAR
jgi:hypothetical protein